MREKNLKVGEPAFISNLRVYPVFGENADIEVETLEESCKSERAKILETGTVSELEIDYDGDWPMFIHEGEEIIGARQNRIFATSMLIPAGRHRVPVLCAEEGRWSGNEEFMPSGYIAYPRIRSIVSQSISIHKKPDQQLVWKEITRKQTSLRINSQTRAMTESFSSKENELNMYKDYKAEEGQIGFLAYSNQGFLGAEIFASPFLFAKFLEKLLISYGLDALEHRFYETEGKFISPEKILDSYQKTSMQRAESPGIGEEFRGLTRLLALRALILKKALVHLSILPR
ncbi:MAG: hypothetical protein J7L62_01170 [Candidatus Aminicenantes bacterium]|nr:hypothetical protein [Candidatus Aminicenantes bacterium]